MTTAESEPPENTLSVPHVLTPLLFFIIFSGYALNLAHENITRLQKYEEKSEKAAQWSNTAAQRLRKTRTTQTISTVVLLSSLLSSTLLFARPIFTSYTNTLFLLRTVSLLNFLASVASRRHMANFWNDKNQVRIPFVEDFNEAVRGSEKVVQALGLLGIAWVWLLLILWAGLDFAVWSRSVEWVNLAWGFPVWLVGMMIYY